MKKIILGLIIIGAGYFFFGTKKGKIMKNVAISYAITPDLINEEGVTVVDRIELPENFRRKTYPEGSFQKYIQNYPLKPFGAKVVNYDGQDYAYQAGHVGVLTLPVTENGLQQCADALIRLRAEYLWENNRKDEIGFNFTSGHYCSWTKYSEGYRPKINGNRVSFARTAAADASKANFYNYLNLIFMYSGTQSLHDELSEVDSISDVEVGDMLIYPGSPGHVVMVADIAEDDNGRKLLIFAQGNTPAQSVHLLKNPNDLGLNPWYETEIGQYLEIPTYYFNEVKFVRFK
ncbi:DUF4846 domain-containing protein [Aureitalea sp. L0-47]|uniref:DUF4846 domain-containing protein n=1 Tax=Aureitalea sp. L0-47 TaxID=2816962 RepID=UPI0022389F1E|nr:DUF4846 domain-containing protein [Aureitalea sp. L0-47]MCW5521150.1 DUF4846 domain-containing protein [Aureitalea sp. L0-47]